MTPDIEMLKTIQPLFKEWNVGDRGILICGEMPFYLMTPIFQSNDKEGTIRDFINVAYKNNKYMTTHLVSDCLHYPYVHQLWEKVDWKQYFIENNKQGLVHITDIVTYIIGDEEPFLDPETALLKALVEQEGL